MSAIQFKQGSKQCINLMCIYLNNWIIEMKKSFGLSFKVVSWSEDEGYLSFQGDTMCLLFSCFYLCFHIICNQLLNSLKWYTAYKHWQVLQFSYIEKQICFWKNSVLTAMNANIVILMSMLLTSWPDLYNILPDITIRCGLMV